MEEVFIEYLDQIYWEGYGEALREDNPKVFYSQLSEFSTNHKLPI